MGLFFVEHVRERKRGNAPKAKPSTPSVRSQRVNGHHSLEAVRVQAQAGCPACSLNLEPLQHPKMEPTGAARPIIYILGEAPGKDEDERGEQFIGKSGKLLRSYLPEDFRSKIRWNNTVRCRPPDNRDPTLLETECCRQLQVRDIEIHQPKVVVTVGRLALHWILGRDNIAGWHGRFIPAQIGSHTCWVYPIYHPAFVMRNSYESKWEEMFSIDLHQVFDVVTGLGEPGVETPIEYYSDIKLLYDVDDIVRHLEKLAALKDVAIDIETTGFRPYAHDAKILSIAIGTYDETIAFALRHRGAQWTPQQLEQLETAVKAFLLSPGCKWAHHLAFELEWLSHFYGDDILYRSAWGCTMAQAYCLDPRRGVLSLGDVTRLNFGFDVKDLSQLNIDDLDNEPLEAVLKYNGLDTKYTEILAQVQAADLETRGLLDLYQFHVRRIVPIVRAQRKGLVVNAPEVAAHATRLAAEVERLIAVVANHPDAVAFKAINGKFNAESNTDLVKFFRDHLKLPNGEQRDGKYSTDESILSTIDHEVAAAVVKLRVTRKLLSTYIEPFMEKHPDHPKRGKLIHDDGLIHCHYHHTRTITGRLSSSDPNEQNFPKRDDKEIRSIIGAPPGHWLVNIDQGQIEARVIAMASRDAVLVKAIREGYDIHMSWAEKIAIVFPKVVGGKKNLGDKKALKQFRSDVKNVWTFPLFYGAMISSVANMLNLTTTDRKGRIVPDPKLVALYDEFWDMFSGVRSWQQQMLKQRETQGMITSLIGRTRRVPLSDNETFNTPIQGTASDLVVDAMERLSSISYHQNLPQLQPVMNVHDDLGFYVPDETLERDIETIAREMVRITFPWINVPLLAEISVGRNWYDQEEVGSFTSADFGFTYHE